jgi:glycosyltransferase involved in cell wall biosynthesis
MKVCFVTGLTKFGAERQTYDIAMRLADRHDVSVVGFSRPGAVVDHREWAGLNLHVVQYGLGPFNYLIRKPCELTGTLRKLDPDVCIQSAVGDLTGLVGTYCRLHNSRFIYHSMSNRDVRPQTAYAISHSPLSLCLYSLGLSLTDVIIAQTQEIARLFSRDLWRLKRVAVVPPLYDASTVQPPQRKSNFILWLARLVWYKRPEIFVELARQLPKCQFVMAGTGPLQPDIERLAKSVANLKFVGGVDHDRAEELCGEACLFVNTSDFEGFPTTLLECGARETPFISLSYDPDEVIRKYRIGLHSRSFDRLTEDVSFLMKDNLTRRELGRNARSYVIENHSPEITIEAYDRILHQLGTKHRLQPLS